METLELLGVALGLATLAGINLYLTVFVTGLAIQQGWITLLPKYAQLDVLANPIIFTVAGILFALEFFADKVPWVDSLWDAVHTLIRPVGGAFLAITVMGEAHPVYDVLVGLLGGGMALTTHSAKAGTRLLVNTSPEPFSNIGLSLAEDATVIAGLALVYKYPLAALVAAVIAVGLVIWLAPRVFRAARATLWFMLRRALHAAGASPASAEPPPLPPDLEISLVRERGEDFTTLWAAPCVASGGAQFRRNSFGWLLLTGGDHGGLDFAQNVESRPRVDAIALDGWKAIHRPGLVCDRVVIYEPVEGSKLIFQFDRSRREMAETLVRMLNQRSLQTSNQSAAATV